MKGKTGHIVNITSVAARYAEPDDPMYAASKHAAGSLNESIRLALAGQPIRITAIMPGAVATNLVRSMPQEKLLRIAKMFGQDGSTAGSRRHCPGVRGVASCMQDIADVLFALCVPDNVQVSEIMIRQPLNAGNGCRRDEQDEQAAGLSLSPTSPATRRFSPAPSSSTRTPSSVS